MAKISISLPDELKARLDTYAQETDLKRSEAVVRILDLFFTDQLRSPTAIDPTRLVILEQDVDSVMTYLADLHHADPERRPRPPWMEDPVRSFIRTPRPANSKRPIP